MTLLVCVPAPPSTDGRGRKAAYRLFFCARDKLKTKQVRVLELEPQTHRPAGVSAGFNAGLPYHGPIDLIAAQRRAVGQCQSFKGMAIGVLHFDPHFPGLNRARQCN